jgi:hypothetical protein
VPTPEDFPQANRSFPKHVKANSNLHQPIVPCAGSVGTQQYLPALVRPDVLQLTFRVFKVKPSDAALGATIVPSRFSGKIGSKGL